MSSTTPRSADWQIARNVLCIRLDALGDVLMTTPALRALRELPPGRRLTLLTSPAAAALVPLIPEIDDCLAYEAPWMKAASPRSDSRHEFAMIEQLRQGGFDAAVIFTVYSQNPLPAALLCLLAGIPRRLAHCRENAYQLLTDQVNEPEPLTECPDARPVPADQPARLTFANVSFRYRAGGPVVLDSINLTVEPGMTVGVIGPSGSGKSTLLSLAPRLYDVEAGAVLLNGRNVQDLRLVELRKSVVLVPQQAILFEGTLLSNLLYAAGDATPAEISRVLQALDLDELVRSLPLGLKTPVGERGLTLSGGQR
jgi:ABC-type multidrug transport system fused ATPase/permease subunit